VRKVGTILPLEIVRITVVTGDVLTITRAQESTSALSVDTTYEIFQSATKKAFTDIEAVALGGTVTSVALTTPTGLTTSGSPVTGSGTLAITEDSQSANLVKAGPSSGSAATPTYRSLVKLDQVSTTVYNDAGNTYSTGVQDMGSATSLKVPTSSGAAPTSQGLIAYDTTQDTIVAAGKGSLTGQIVRHLSTQQPAADTLSAPTITTNETAFSTGYQLPANFLTTGKKVRVTVTFENVATATVPTSLLKMRVQKSGPTNVNLYASVANAMAAGTKRFSAIFMITGTAATGSSVAVITGSVLAQPNNSVLTNGNTIGATSISTNVAQTIQFTWQYGAGTAGNSIQLLEMIVEEIN
jgi:hypothetical protein